MDSDLSAMTDEELAAELARLEETNSDLSAMTDEELAAELKALEALEEPVATSSTINSADDAIAAATGIGITANPVVETPVVKAPVVEDPVVKAPVVKAPVVEDPEVKAPVVEDPEVKAPVVEEFAVVPARKSTPVNTSEVLSALNQNFSASEILDYMYESGVTKLDLDGQSYDFEAFYIANKGDPKGSQDILNTLLTGSVVRDMNILEREASAYGNAAVTILGLPADFINSLVGAGHAGINALASINAPEGVDDPESPDYDPDFYLSPESSKIDFIDKWGSQSIRDNLRKIGIDLPNSVREIPEEHRAFYQFSRVIGENIPFVFAITGKMLASGLKIAQGKSKDVHAVFEIMARNPKMALNGEALALLGGASGAAIMQDQYPNNPYGQLIGELGGSFGFALAPALTKTVLKNLPGLQLAKNAFKFLKVNVSTEAARDMGAQDFLIAAETYRQGLLKQAEDMQTAGNIDEVARLRTEAKQYEVDNILKSLAEIDSKTNVFPAGTATDNDALVGAQNFLFGQNTAGQFSSKVNSQISAGLANIEASSRIMLQGEGFEKFGELMQTRYLQMLIKTADTAKRNKMLEVLKAIPENNTEQAGLVIQNILREGKTNLRNMETFWWDRVDKSVSVNPADILRTIDAQRARLPEGAAIEDGAGTPNQIMDTLRARVEAGENINVGEILAFRSYFLNRARMSGSGSNPDKVSADIYDNIASSAVELLNTIGGAATADVKMARKFSSLLNAHYNRFWVKGTLESAPSGGLSNDPRLTQESMMSGTDLQTKVAMEDAAEASNFADVAAVGTVNQQTDDALEAGARQAAADTPADPDPRFARAGLIEGTTTLSMANALKSFWDKTPPRPERIKETDLPKSADEAIIANERGDVVFDSTTRRYPENEAKKPPPEDVYEGEGVFSLNNEEVYASQQLDTPPERIYLGPAMSAVQEKVLLGEIRRLRDNSIRDSIPTEQALNGWLDSNGKLLARFPQVEAKARLLLKASEESSEYLAKVENFRNSDNFNSEVAKVFNGSSPVEDYGKLVTIIKDTAVELRKGPEDVKKAMDHLRASTFDMMLNAAVKEDGVDFLALTQQLFSPVDTKASKGITRIEIMQQNGLIDQEAITGIGELLAEGVRVQKTTEAGTQFDTVLAQNSTMLNNLARIAGANIGVLSGSGQASIQTAAIGSQFMKNLVEKLPNQKALRQLEVMFLNPEMLANYISKNRGKQESASAVIQETINTVKNQFVGQPVRKVMVGFIWNGTKYVARQIGNIPAQTFADNKQLASSIVTRSMTGDNSEVDRQMLELEMEPQ